MINYNNYPISSGIYAIYNNKNKKYYVGSAVNLRRRAYEHSHSLDKGKHYNIHLQRSFDSDGRDFFDFLVLELCEKKDLVIRENYWIEFYKSIDHEKGYNFGLASQTFLGKKHSPETIQKIKEARKKQIFSPESIAKGAETRRGRKMNFSPEIRKKLSIRARMMDRSFCKTQDFKDKISKIVIEKALSKPKNILCHQTQKLYSNCGEIARELNLNYKNIWRVLAKQRNHYKGFTFEYIF